GGRPAPDGPPVDPRSPGGDRLGVEGALPRRRRRRVELRRDARRLRRDADGEGGGPSGRRDAGAPASRPGDSANPRSGRTAARPAPADRPPGPRARAPPPPAPGARFLAHPAPGLTCLAGPLVEWGELPPLARRAWSVTASTTRTGEVNALAAFHEESGQLAVAAAPDSQPPFYGEP